MTITWTCPACGTAHDIEYGVVGRYIPGTRGRYDGDTPPEYPEVEIAELPEVCTCGRVVTEADEDAMVDLAWADVERAQEDARWGGPEYEPEREMERREMEDGR